MNRRKVLRLLGASPMVGKTIAKFKVDDLTASAGRQYLPGGIATPSADPSNKVRIALKLPFIRDQLLKLIEEDCHQVNSIDPDIAVWKSVSLSAKIVYQRQRNIKNRLKAIEEGQSWYRLDAFLRNLESS